MSVTFPGLRRKTTNPVATKITIGLVPLFFPVTNRHGRKVMFGSPHKNQLGRRGSNPVKLKWDVGATSHEVGGLELLDSLATNVQGTGYIKPGSCSQIAVACLRNPKKRVWACPDLGWDEDNVEITADGVQRISGWWFRSVTLTTNPERQMWPHELTAIKLQVGAGTAPLLG